ncbi:hypothetical protein C8N35_11237 [Breoghania corrubedonensis]|uniref:Methyltransferase family protein n=1 Tax=Breoghania corrubedonensis TaxID=665038 RepID=A0A2T5UW56_9HYPH|nr:hypothetical protein [Breoghania corrubedonensis]PTW55712.1 hypothetical protein C8N35_11237 [Breoghania corrubedonensis]
MRDVVIEDINETRANLDHINNHEDPREFFRVLQPLGYRLPDAAKPVFDKVIDRLAARRGTPVNLLDLGASYGIDAAILKYDLSVGELYSHWSQSHLERTEPAEIISLDHRFFAALRKKRDITVTGIDMAPKAIEFALKAGLLDAGFAANLEAEALPAAGREALADIDLVITTGCVGKVTARSFERLLPAMTKAEKPWFANFVLRTVAFDDVAAKLAEHGYVTEKLEDTSFIQRRFADRGEREEVMAALEARALNPLPLEEKGLMVAEFFLSRPRDEAEAMPLETLMAR